MSQYLLNPRGRFNFESNPIAPRPSALEKKVLGLVDNSKVNADRYLKKRIPGNRSTWNGGMPKRSAR